MLRPAWASRPTSSRGYRGRKPFQLYVDTLERAGLSQQEMTFYLEAMASDAAPAAALRNGGAEMARLGDQGPPTWGIAGRAMR